MEIMEYGSKTARTVLLQPVDEHDAETIENELALIRGSAGEDFRLTAFRVGDWNRDLSPWEAPPVFGQEGFGGRARDTLEEILTYCTDGTKTYIIGGYSLAGLFALWAACETDVFSGVAAASPSVWFPGFPAYLRDHEIRSGHVYLSLGDREERTRNPVMRTVGDEIRAAYALLRERGTDCVLEWNEGNHFRDADARTAKAFSWVMKRK
ncbi:MAG: esterase [Clostridia bacterium]|nr:esterase [Clostridia bacterium]MBQ6722342.1 esterase [Clostridia bacterium]